MKAEAVGIVLDALHGSAHVGLQTLEVDDAVLALVAAATMADGDVTVAVATCVLLEVSTRLRSGFAFLSTPSKAETVMFLRAGV